MRSAGIALGLFLLFLGARATFRVQGQEVAPANTVDRAGAPDTRARRLAALEAQEDALSRKQHGIESELERASESSRRLHDRLEVMTVAGDSSLENLRRDMELERTQIAENVRQLRLELESVAAERRRVQEEAAMITAVRVH